MTFPSTRMQSIASNLVHYFSSAATLRRVTKGTYDPVTGGYTGGTTTDYPIEATPRADYKLSEIDGTLIQQGDFKVFIADAPIEPNVSSEDYTDTVLVEGVEYTIVNVKPAMLPDNQTAGWKLQCRG